MTLETRVQFPLFAKSMFFLGGARAVQKPVQFFSEKPSAGVNVWKEQGVITPWGDGGGADID